jgi:hypothetical protein
MQEDHFIFHWLNTICITSQKRKYNDGRIFDSPTDSNSNIHSNIDCDEGANCERIVVNTQASFPLLVNEIIVLQDLTKVVHSLRITTVSQPSSNQICLPLLHPHSKSFISSLTHIPYYTSLNNTLVKIMTLVIDIGLHLQLIFVTLVIKIGFAKCRTKSSLIEDSR